MPQEWSKKPTIKSSFADLKVGLGAILSGNAPVNSSGSSGPTAAQQAFFASASSNQSDDGPGYARRPAGPTPDQLIAQQQNALLKREWVRLGARSMRLLRLWLRR
jgi:hypothetical protein